jgi:hypothetical protein
VATATASEEAPSLDACEAEILRHPDDEKAYRCMSAFVGPPKDRRAEAIRRLEGIVASHPEIPWPRLVLAAFFTFPDAARAEQLAREAAEICVRRGDPAGEAKARTRLLRIYSVHMRLENAAGEEEAARSAAERSEDIEIQAAVEAEAARLASHQGDVGRAWLLARRVELAPWFPRLSGDAKITALFRLDSIAWRLGLGPAARRYAERAVEVWEREGPEERRYDVLKNLAIRLGSLAGRGEADAAETTALALQTLALARERSDLAGELSVALVLARVASPDEAVRQLEVVERRTRHSPHVHATALIELGVSLVRARPERAAEAIGLIERGLALRRMQGDPVDSLAALLDLLDARLRVGPREEAVSLALRALDLIESLGDRQSGEEPGMRFFAAYAEHYYRLVGLLLPTADVALAFEVSERMRARALLAHLERMGAAPDRSTDAWVRRREVLDRIAELQLEGLVSRPDPARTREIESDLRRLDLEAEALRAQALPAQEHERLLADAAAVGRALGPETALLSFLLPEEGDAWVFCVTEGMVKASRLPDAAELERAARFWLGAIQLRDGTEVEGAARLYRDVLERAVAELPPSIRRLVIVPDGPLHHVPFDALRAAPQAPAMAERFEIMLAPSATVWLRLAGRTAPTGEPRALILADPATPAASGSEIRGLKVGRLPHAREEARAAARALGDRSEVRLGRKASEAFLKTAQLARFRILHFATHAWIDDESPARSAILLAPGGESEDGLLQAREVAELDLHGALVTLSACRSASGLLLRGEGVLGLSRALFQADAHAVVGGLWPLRDAETAGLMDGFYRRLGEGRPISWALAEAKRERIREGAPAAAWAGVVVVGAGGNTAWPPGLDRAGRPGVGTMALLAATLLLLAGGVLFGVQRARRRTT